MKPDVKAFFDAATFTYSYVVADPQSNAAVIIDPVLDYDQASGRTKTQSAEAIVDHVRQNGLAVAWILETHVHADHLSGASYLQQQLGGLTGIGSRVVEVQQVFGELFNAGSEFKRDGSQFDRLFEDQEVFTVGSMEVCVMHTPGHTPACATYVFDGAAFVGDTIFMPDFGTARTDFPGGDAATLYRSIRRILALPPETELYMCHDYGSNKREGFEFLTTVADERAANIHIADGISEAEFVKFRTCRDAELAAPALLLPSVQFNMRGAQFAPPEDNGVHYLKIPVRAA